MSLLHYQKRQLKFEYRCAEGRLILCDAITYAQQLGATRIIDIATLTGACVAALGDVYTGVFSNSDDYYKEFEESMKKK